MANKFDSANYPSREPEELIVGDRAAWKRADLGADYPPASYSLKYSLRLESTGTEIEITAGESGDEYVVEVASATTTSWTAGTYVWQAYITRTLDSERVLVDSGSIKVVTNLDASSADPRTHAKIVLDAIEAVIEGRATKDQEEYSIAGRSLKRTPIADLLLLRDRYRVEVAGEQAADRVASGVFDARKIQVRF